MKPSEMLEAGIALTSAEHGTFINPECGACALGSMYVGLVGTVKEAHWNWVHDQATNPTYLCYDIWAADQIPALWQEVGHPVDGGYETIKYIVEDLFELEDWSREQIVAWLREIGQ